ncbi:hypothetical protein F5148DRAFT_1279546 [Russula earlei]|uniref:Uncharacterized protein n=1 Tax=Russula earlei TaxID=71964 RepID=A0ACC0ULX4_9AGAM|nr:hypothetical protein F5148DRAFT_1279546 [Russula earlei]
MSSWELESVDYNKEDLVLSQWIGWQFEIGFNTNEEIMIVSGQKVLNPREASKFLDELESMNSDIQSLYTYGNTEGSKGPWDQEMFEDLLAKWIVATDQPFYTVNEPEF